MRVTVDARFFGPAGTGLGRYTAELVRNLLLVDPTVELTLIVLNASGPALPRDPRVRLVPFPVRWYSVAEQVQLPALLKRTSADLYHFPHFNVPLTAPRPFVVTVHDLILHEFPTDRATTLGPTRYRLKRLAYRFIIRQALARAERVLTVTQTSAEAIRRRFPQAAGKVVMTYEGPSDLQPPHDDGDDRALVRALGVRPPFLLYVGNAYPHKNLELLLDALPVVRAQYPDVQLALVGATDFFHDRLRGTARAKGLRVGTEVVFPGFVSDRQLVALYRQASLYVFPSLAEGFGLPALEAMTFSLPVAAARASCLPEVLGDAAAYFDPYDPRAAAAVIARLLGPTDQRRTLIARGHAQVHRYSWRRLAAETLAVYRAVARQRPG